MYIYMYVYIYIFAQGIDEWNLMKSHV
jgi:hypothetical protein